MSVSLADPIAFPRGPGWRNRIALAPLTNWQSHDDGTLGDDEYRFLTRRAEGGFGLVMTCAAAVQKSGVSFPGQLAVYSDDHVEGLARLAAGLRARGAASAVQLQHAGSRGNPEISGEQAVSPFAYAKRNVRALTTAEVEQLVRDFVAAAVRCERAGIDGVELHGAHGYMLCQFLNAEENNRDDGYGGSYRNRTRIYREIIDGIRAATGADFQLGVRLSPEKYAYSTDEAIAFAEELLGGGQLDYLDMSLWDSFKLPDESGYHPARLVDVFGRLPRSGGVRLGVAGHIFSSKDAQDCLDSGADFVFFGRGAILHHDMARRAIEEPEFVSKTFPVTRDYLAQQAVGPAFQTYLATGWKNYVAD
ncbi:NADH:flavin oxidoreductase [Flavisphingomonas formosensis]|uniref:NADH:flavin oxidoreductase n=1 Tax=Flavisphingomonas formosensis TaxID=861534 RepID=UPI0012F91F2E|nr:NADH:flavin oxidoreductase [Sphingomonas formosensis]